MDKIIGFIGCGNMAKAMIKGILSANLVDKENIYVSAKSKESLERVREEFGVKTTLENKKIGQKSDFLIVAVKPYLYESVLEEVKESIRDETIVISIGAGISLDFLKKNLKENAKFIKTMPNTPALVGEAMTAISAGENLNEEEMEEVISIFKSFGKVQVLDESLMDAFTSIAGSSPAYIFMLIEAMGDAGVRDGLPRAMAYNMAAQAVLGSAKMVIDTGLHPGLLKDNVCSPGGTTIEAVTSLEKTGFRSSIIEAMRLCTKKSREMKK